ncbi:hypothetical protein C8R46DRAFT_1253087 [Mycena filopes]|nr:hypothetical protein C8R46DRAFT_1253087 [Mycena filopes]
MADDNSSSSSPPAQTASGNTPASNNLPPTLQEQLAAARERVKAHLAAGATETSRKRKASDASDDGDAEEGTYKWYGRNLARSLGIFTRIHTITEHGVKLELADPAIERPPPTAKETRLTESWEILKNTIPGFADDMIDLGGDVKLRKSACARYDVFLSQSRYSLSQIQRGGAVIEYLLPSHPPGDDSPAPVLTPAIPKSGAKAPRGMNHPVTAAALCPIQYPDAPETYTAILNNDPQFPVLSSLLPAFMYPAGHVYNEADLEEGLLDNHILRAIAKHIYQGTSMAREKAGANRGKAGNAALNGVTALSARDIAYVGCQARFAMSAEQSWSGTDGDFSYEEFYWKVVDLLLGEDGQAILDRFNFDVFGTVVANKSAAPVAANIPDEFEILQRQRAAKRARLAREAQEAQEAAPATA